VTIIAGRGAKRVSLFQVSIFFGGGEIMVRAIDVQQVIMQIEHAEKVQQVQQQHSEMQQRYFELHLKEEKKLLREKIKDSEETRGAVIKEKGERERRRDAGGQHDHQEREDGALQQEGEEALQQGIHVNIKV
jgi:hypothetical protein